MQEKMCPNFEYVFDLLGKRWTGKIIHVLLSGPKRFSEMADMIPNIKARMLSERLKELEEAGIIRRNVYPETPVRVEYRLTKKGESLKPGLEALRKWGEEWLQA